jgi:hypothetical protein
MSITVNTGTNDGEDGVEQRCTDARIDVGCMLLPTGDVPNKALHHSLSVVRHHSIHIKNEGVEHGLAGGKQKNK